MRAVFLDRDGVLTIPEFRDGRSFAPRRLADFRLYDDAAVSARRMKDAGFGLVVVTNQPDVGHGLLALDVVEAMHRRLAAAIPVDAIESCYHRQDEGCDCRKPKSGMLRCAAARLGIDCRCSFMIGDRASDVEAGRNVGCRTIFIDRGYIDEQPGQADFIVKSLAEATSIILRCSRGTGAMQVADQGRAGV
ncbi:MAG: HAD-IIIA family hydrolase [Alphaproteobacteria bacterium]|nr:HAD-IIIA family hydrolase [Alphaproteobacteria bacterium]